MSKGVNKHFQSAQLLASKLLYTRTLLVTFQWFTSHVHCTQLVYDSLYNPLHCTQPVYDSLYKPLPCTQSVYDSLYNPLHCTQLVYDSLYNPLIFQGEKLINV